MSPTTKKELDAPTAATVRTLLEAPDRERQAAEERAASAVRLAAQATLREGLATRLAVLVELGDEVGEWFAGRPVVTLAVFEETVGDHARELIDRVVLLAREVLDTSGPAAQATAQRWLDELAQPMAREAFEAALAGLKAMEEKEPILRHRAAAWRALRATTVEQLRRAIALTDTQCAWLAGERHA